MTSLWLANCSMTSIAEVNDDPRRCSQGLRRCHGYYCAVIIIIIFVIMLLIANALS